MSYNLCLDKIKVKPGVPNKLDDGDNPTFEEYESRVNRFLLRQVGFTLSDLPDRDYCYKWWRNRVRPIHAANKAIGILNRNGGDF